MTDEKVCVDEDIFAKSLCMMFSVEWLRKTARRTGFIKRERKITPEIFFWVLVLGYGPFLQRTLAGMKRMYEKAIKQTISDSSWYYRFTPELVAFLHECVIHGMKQLAKESCRSLDAHLNCFLDVLIQDSTIIRLNKVLADKWPAARSKTVAAGVKVSVLVSARANGPKSVSIIPERTSDIKTLRIGSWIRDRIFLIDLGFYKYGIFSKINNIGGYFVSRMKSNANPVILGLNKGCKLDKGRIKGKKLAEIINGLNGETLDAKIEIKYYKKEKTGRRELILEEFRLVAIYNLEDEKYHVYITNISDDLLTAEDIAYLYKGRWEIELIFKELKSKYQLDVVETTNVQVIEAFIWISILTMIASREIYNIVRMLNPDKQIARFTQMRWCNVFVESSPDFLREVLCYIGVNDSDIIKTKFEVYGSQALDPHVNRERFRDNLWA
jgi:putative transposase